MSSVIVLSDEVELPAHQLQHASNSKLHAKKCHRHVVCHDPNQSGESWVAHYSRFVTNLDLVLEKQIHNFLCRLSRGVGYMPRLDKKGSTVRMKKKSDFLLYLLNVHCLGLPLLDCFSCFDPRKNLLNIVKVPMNTLYKSDHPN